MRELLEAFRLPGESQQISRITETFAEIYIASGPCTYLRCSRRSMLTVRAAEVKSQDAVYVLAYSIIMLNTDLHSPQIRVCIIFVTDLHFTDLWAETDDHRGLYAESERRERWHGLLYGVPGTNVYSCVDLFC